MITKEQFRCNLWIIQQDIITNNQNIDVNLYYNTKVYIANNANDSEVIQFKKWFASYLMQVFRRNDFINSLSFNPNLVYGKYQEMFKTFPIRSIDDSCIRFFNLLINYYSQFYGTLVNNIKGILWFLNVEGVCPFPNEQMNTITQFIDNNKAVFKGGRYAYSSLEDEIKYYNDNGFLFAGYNNDFNSYIQTVSSYCGFNSSYNNDVISSYKNRKLGNIGEVYFYKVIQNWLNTCFTARDLGDGFGFDMYHQSVLNNYLHEYLIEVKTTANLNGDDFFMVSPNEYEKMTSCSNLPFSHYYISRIFFNSTNNTIIYNTLAFDDSNGTLCWYNKKDEVMYELLDNNGYKFVRCNNPSRIFSR